METEASKEEAKAAIVMFVELSDLWRVEVMVKRCTEYDET